MVVVIQVETNETSEIRQRRRNRSFELGVLKQNLGDAAMSAEDAPHKLVVIVYASAGIKPVLLIVALTHTILPVFPIHAVPDVNPRFAITRRKLVRTTAPLCSNRRCSLATASSCFSFSCAQG
jgi:hypothetical protein